VKRYNIIQR